MLKGKSLKLKKSLSFFLALTTTANFLTVFKAAGATENDTLAPYPYAVFAADDQAGISFEVNSLTLNGNGYTKGSFNNAAQSGNMNGEIIEAEKNIEASSGNLESFDVNTDMIYIHTKLIDSYFSTDCQSYDEDLIITDMNNNINQPIYVVGKMNIDGNLALNSAIGAVSDITIFNGNVNGNNSVIYSKFGNISIEGDQVSVNGLIYAPFGNVIINCTDFNTNGLIIAQNVFVNGSVANINYNDSIAEFVGTYSETLTWTNKDFKYLADTDEDNLPDVIEKAIYKTDPFNPDTDSDRLPDGYEALTIGTNPKIDDSDENGVLDRDEDFDRDGLTNGDEYINSTDPLYDDTDGDKLLDGEEVNVYFTDPLVMDTDSDGLDDYDEVQLDSDPNNSDSDGNGIPDGAEKRLQVITHEAEDPDSAVRSVTVSINATGNIDRTTHIRNIMNTDMMCTNVVGLVGEPYSIESDSEFDKATITFNIDKSKLGDTDFNNLMFLWHDVENHEFVELATILDEVNSTVSVETTHFSKYMIVDKEKWFEAWSKKFNYNPKQDYVAAPNIKYNTVLAIDCSGSMKTNDPITTQNNRYVCERINAAEGFVKIMNSSDQTAIVLFDSTAKVAVDMTSDKDKLKNALQKVVSSGGTSFDAAIKASLAELDSYVNSVYTVNRILLLSDGESSASASLLQDAKDKKIPIYTIGLGSGSYDYILKNISDSTGGEFYKAFNADELVGIYTKFGISGDFDTTDTDGDGLYDAVEAAGIRLENGNVIYTDPTLVDTDGDGLNDGVEIDPTIRWKALDDTAGYVRDREYYFVMYSDPSDEDNDSDDDGITDDDEEIIGTDPYNKDTDGDRLEDGWEHINWYDPLDSNPDGDTYDDYAESLEGTNPFKYDLTAGEWAKQFAEGCAKGDFIEDPTVPQLLGQIAISIIPGIGTVADIRDTIGNVVHGHWFMAVLSAVGVAPVLGDGIKSSSKAATFITKNIDKTDEIADLLLSVSKKFPDDFAKLIPTSSLDEIAEAFKTNNHMSRSTYDELAAIFKKAGKKLPTLSDDFTDMGIAFKKVASNGDIWKKLPRERGFAIDVLLDNNLGRTYETYDHYDKISAIATSVKSIDPMCKSYQTPSKFKGMLNKYLKELAEGKDYVKFKNDPQKYDILLRELKIALPDVPLTKAQKDVISVFIKNAKEKYNISVVINIIE